MIKITKESLDAFSRNQELADKLTNEALATIYGERFTSLEDVEEDDELNRKWDFLNESFYQALANLYLI